MKKACLFSAVLLLSIPLVSAAPPEVTSRTVPKNPEELKAFEAHVRKIVKKVSPATVRINTGGSGVIVSEDGIILTVAHVGRKAGRTISVTFPDGRRVKAKTLGNYAGVDAGMMKITDKGKWPYVKMARSSELKGGEWCLAIGYPVSFVGGKPPAVRLGRVLNAGKTMIASDAIIMGGDSGGPLFNLEGEVIGIDSRCHQSRTCNFSVPSDVYRDSWERLLKGEDWSSQPSAAPRAFLGVSRTENQTHKKGAEIDGVVPNSAAAKAGLKKDDIITKLNDEKITGFEDLLRFMSKRKPGDQITIEVLRGEETLKLKAKLGNRSSVN